MRPADWSPVGLATDPVPGDVVMVLAGGNDYLDVADAIERAGTNVRRLELSGSTVSDAVDALMGVKEETVAEISRAYERYRAAGQALVEYAGALERAQADADGALERARAAQQQEQSASASRSYYVGLADAAEDEDTRQRYERLADRHGDDAAAAAGAVAGARADVESAVAYRDRAAERAAGEIERITSDDGLNDSWWDNWGSRVVAAITDVAGWISTAAGILALAVAWIPVVGQALAGVLLVVAAIGAVINALGNVVLASTGERTWLEAGIAVLGAALSGVGLGAVARGLGRLVTTRVLTREAAGNSRLLSQAHNAVTAFRPGHAARLLRNDPRGLTESARMWAGALRRDVPVPANGQRVYRLYGNQPGYGGAGADIGGASWTPTPPYTLRNPRSTMGLPTGGESGAYNAADHLVRGELVDAGAVVGARHGLPLDGLPGGAPEYIVPGWTGSGSIWVESVTTFRVP